MYRIHYVERLLERLLPPSTQFAMQANVPNDAYCSNGKGSKELHSTANTLTFSNKLLCIISSSRTTDFTDVKFVRCNLEFSHSSLVCNSEIIKLSSIRI
jgi:hypothetical protein